MKLKLLLFTSALLLNVGLICAQTSATYAHSTSRQWKGIDVEALIDPNTNQNQDVAVANVYLYNVGTGKFVIEGGSWGIEGRLFHEDFGRKMTLMKSGRIHSGITEENVSNNKNSFGCNVPGVTRDATWNDSRKYCYTTIMDGANKYSSGSGSRPRKWTFQRVETDPDADTYTYYMWETMVPAKNYGGLTPGQATDFHLGAVYGEWHNANDKGDGYFVFLDDDRTCWTTADVIGNQQLMDVDGDMISVDELYQWRVISEEEFIEVLNSDEVGINPSISSLVPDRDFTRNSDDFFDYWFTENLDNHDYSSLGRRGHTWGNTKRGAPTDAGVQQQPYYNDHPWNEPVKLKEVFQKNGDMEFGFRNGKFGFMSFEGVGRVYTEVIVPKPGWYQVESVGFCQSDNNDAFMYAKAKEAEPSDVPFQGYSEIELERVTSGTYQKNNMNNCLVVGEELTFNAANHRKKLWVYIPDDGDFYTNVDKRTMQIGFVKYDATQSVGENYQANTYYYDTDWVCVDDIKVSYMGIAPAFLYEEEENLDYLKFNPEDLDNYIGASPNGRYSGAVGLVRTLKTDQWNSFSLPIPLTGEQVRYAFGKHAVLAKINSIGGMSRNPYVIDFETVDLKTTDVVVVPGQFYLLKPTVEPATGKNPRGTEVQYYNLGKTFFSVNENEQSDYIYPIMDLNTVMESQNILSYDGEGDVIEGGLNDGAAFVNYVQTPGYQTFRVTGGIYNGNEANGIYSPKGSYGVSNNNLVHLNKDTRIKGFRGWITLTNEITGGSEPVEMSVNARIDGQEPTYIGNIVAVPATVPMDAVVYDMAGRAVGKMEQVAGNLPKGVYIVDGKKFFVR